MYKVKDTEKTKDQLIREIEVLKKRLTDFEKLQGKSKKAENVLREHEQYKLIVQAVPDIIYELTPDGRFALVSDSIRQLGYDPTELIGKHFENILHPDDYEAVSRSVVLQKYAGRATGEAGSPGLFDERRTGKRIPKIIEVRLALKYREGMSTGYCYCEAHSSGKWKPDVKERNKEFLGSIGIIRDITGHGRRDETLQSREEQLRNVIEKIADGIIILNKDGTIRFANPAAEKLFDRRAEEFYGKEFGFPLIAGESTEINIVRNNGRMCSAEMRVVEIEWEKKTAYLASIRDITEIKKSAEFKAEVKERKKSEAQLRKQKEELERSNQELEQFAYVASHDLQEPLRMVTSYVQLLARRYKGKLDGDADDFIGFVFDGATRMQRLINDLLAFSRVGTRGKELVLIDSAASVEKAVSNLQLAIEDSGAAVTYDELPTVMADDTQFVQLFQNLIGNAIKYRDVSPPEIHIGADRRNGKWVFSIRDNGIGIDQRYKERIFVIFQRLHTKEKYSGTGIGLALCKKIVERHGGHIWVESGAEKGSVFYFSVPAANKV
jgi:PAS domain S-box-containing protein